MGVIPVQKKKKLAPFIQHGLDRANEYYSRLDKSNAYVVAMCKYFSSDHV